MSSGVPLNRLILSLAAFFPDSYGGAERQALILAEAFGRLGVDVTIAVPTIDKEVALYEEREFGRIIRKRVRHYPNFGGKYILSFLMWSLWFPWKFRNSKWKGVPVYCFHARLHALGPAIAAVRNKAPLLIKLGGGGEASEFHALRVKKYFYGHWVEALLRRKVGAFVANSREIADELRALGIEEERITEFPNGVVLPDSDWLAEAKNMRTGRRFVYAARLHPDKNVHVLHDAAIAVAGEGQNLTMRLVGDGSERDRLMPQSQAFDGGKTVEYPGFSSDVYSELQAADFFVSASVREGQSNALLEAMSAGLIPIVAPASGTRDVVIEGKTGFVVESADAEGFAEAIRHVLAMSDEERQSLAEAAYNFAKDNLSIDAIARKCLSTLHGNTT